MQKFNFAQHLADLATEADDLDKDMLTPHELRQLMLFRDVALTTVQEFAGDRIGELFGDDAGLDELRAYRTTRLAGTQAAGLASYGAHEQRAAA
jgi:hypothetical protein